MENEILNLKLDDIIPNRFQPREIFDEEALEKLADSIKQHGVIEPIIVRPVANKFEIIAGERRYKASVLAGLTKIPAIVKQMDDKESSIVAYIENEHRAGVSAIEEARTIDRILNTNNMTQEELAKELGINQSTIANKLRLLNLPIEVQDALMHNEISERHARSLLSVKEVEKQIELLNKIKEKRMTVRELESEIKNMYNNMGETNNYENNDVLNSSNNQNQFLNTTIEKPNEPVEPTGSSFMNFLNNYDNSNPLPGSPEAKEQFLTPAPKDDEFIKFVNNYEKDGGLNNDTAPQQTSSNDVTSFLNDFDKNYQIPSETQETSDVTSFLNDFDKNYQIPSETQQTSSNDVTSFLNDFDKNYQIPSETQETSDVTSFLNDFDKNYQIPSENTIIETPTVNNNETQESVVQSTNNNVMSQKETDDFLNFLNRYDSNTNIENSNTTQPDNLSLNNVTPPITSSYNPNQYVEDNPNYVDVSKNITIDNVDDIIYRIKSVIDDIKATSSLKIDTDEINYDDIYQVTIKIDKRNF